MEVGLSFFAASGDTHEHHRYRLLLEAARFADEAGLSALWLPERHFHPFGGLYPNPAVLAAAVAAITSRVSIRAGSVVLPLHHVARIAEEWAVVDNLSGGRVEVSFASGWQPVDFVLAPQNYPDRKRVLSDGISQVRRLWQGEPVEFAGHDGRHAVRTLPRPVQVSIPIWVTAAGSPETAAEAGRLGAGLLTHLAGQTFADLEQLIAVYRKSSRAATGGRGRVALMLHTFLRDDPQEALELALPGLKRYLRSAASLRTAGRGDVPAEHLTEQDWDVMLEHSARRFLESAALIGSPASVRERVERVAAAGVDEVSCLVDFVESADAVVEGLAHLTLVRDYASSLGAGNRKA